MQLRASLADRPPYRKFLILVGLTLVFAVLLTGIGAGLANALFGVDLMNDPSVYDKGVQPGIVGAFRLLQSLAAIGTFILPALLAAYLFSSNSKAYLGLDKKAPVPSVIMVFLLLIIGIPFINWMTFINQGMHLPASLKSVEDWMKSSEEQASHITEILLGTGTLGDLFSNLFVIAVLPAIGENSSSEALYRSNFRNWPITVLLPLCSPPCSSLRCTCNFLDLFHGSYWGCSLASSMHGADPSGYR